MHCVKKATTSVCSYALCEESNDCQYAAMHCVKKSTTLLHDLLISAKVTMQNITKHKYTASQKTCHSKSCRHHFGNVDRLFNIFSLLDSMTDLSHSHCTFSVLLHYLVKYKRLKIQKLQHN